MKLVNLKQAILQAWKERWSDYQWAINMKKFFPKGVTWDILNLAEALLDQAMIGPAPNPLILSYLKYAINSQMVSYSTVLTAISKFDDFSRDLCIQALLEIMDMFCDNLSCHGKAEECIGLCRALMSALNWLLRCSTFYTDKLKDMLDPVAGENHLSMCLQRLESMLSSTKNRALIHIAKLEEPASWTSVEQSLLRLAESISLLPSVQLRNQAEECVSLIRSIPSMLSVHSDQLQRNGFPTVHAVVMLEGTMNLTGDAQPLVEQMNTVKRMQRIPSHLFLLEVWKACIVGLIESPEGTEELKWTAFTFLKIPQALAKLKKLSPMEQDFNEDMKCAFEYLLKLTPLLDKADQRCNCDCVSLLLQECNKLGLLSDQNLENLVAKRTADREQAPRMKSAENSTIQPNPGLILRAEPTVTNILKTMDADHSKSPEGLLGVLGHMLSGKSLDLLLAAAAATGKLKSFARKFIQLNEFTRHIGVESSKAANVRALLFDISFLMLCHVAQTYGSEMILSEGCPSGEMPFFESWMQTCMPGEGRVLNPDHPCFRHPDIAKVEALVALLNTSTEMKLAQTKWHEVCLSIPAAILEIHNAWENGVLSFEAIQKITDNIKGKVCSLAVCAVAWLVAHVRMLGLDERDKSLQMIRQLGSPMFGDNTLQFYNERVIIMSSILDNMCAEVLQQTATQIKFSAPGSEPVPYIHRLPPKKPIKEVLRGAFSSTLEKGWVDSRTLHVFDTLLHMGGVYWFCNNLVKELLRETRLEFALRAVELLYAIFCLDMQQLTLTLLGHVLPSLLTDSAKWHMLMDPPGRALAKLSVWCAMTSYSTQNKGQPSPRQRKRHREDIEDYSSLFPLDDTQQSKLMRLLSSNEEEHSVQANPDRPMNSSLSASQIHNISSKEPLNRVLANLFLLISSVLGAKTAGAQTQFVQWFMEECVESLELGGKGCILQFMPFSMVSELVKVSTLSSPKIVLAITDLTLPLGRRVAAKALTAL
ncbi:mediator of RNA polymerase II transcription subunit 24 isoform X2 [Xenopus tropicalis]|uniref:Mediator of RNA polymerase II transcription subunit 24 n=1 Tax=Xenopus tropicalis TaxID=8364 RepID=A0A8J0SDT5_XENTR|nr:mediator of RNA polymerase II transcription subunit 24 isoform X2 [Xenopus tropicalis]|eukprot:XP_012813137.1 PREDICTED: mediator of RNA polymerase II transcription subunit 24 isoform X2 [Xenopus tropicalis]